MEEKRRSGLESLEEEGDEFWPQRYGETSKLVFLINYIGTRKW